MPKQENTPNRLLNQQVDEIATLADSVYGVWFLSRACTAQPSQEFWQVADCSPPPATGRQLVYLVNWLTGWIHDLAEPRTSVRASSDPLQTSVQLGAYGTAGSLAPWRAASSAALSSARAPSIMVSML